MAQVFPRWANQASRGLVLGLLLLLALTLTICGVTARSSYATGEGVPINQPIPFNHKHHVGDDGIDCRYCHTSVESSSFAGMPPTATCMNCHREIWAETPVIQQVRRHYETGEPISWNRVYFLPDYVFFNHSIHVAKGVGCSTCHGRVDQMPRIWKASSLYMSWCLDCHRNPERYVRPKEQVFNMVWQPPPDQIELGRRLVQEYGIQTKTDCSTCHR